MAYLKFSEYLERYLREENLTPASFAQQIKFRGKPLDEETVVGWLRGIEPGNQVMDQIEEVTGYSFSLSAYDTAYQAAASEWTPVDRTRFPVLGTLDTPEKALALFRTPAAGQWLRASLSLFFGFPRHSGMHHFLKGKAVARETYAKILGKLPIFLRTVAGDAVSVHSPATVLIAQLIEQRRAHGLSRQACANASGINAEALEAMESRQNDQTHFHNSNMAEKICRFLARYDVPVVEFEVQAASVVKPAPDPPVPTSEQENDLLAQLKRYSESHELSEKQLARMLKCNRRTVELWFRRGRKPTPEMVKRLRELIGNPASEPSLSVAKPAIPPADPLLALQDEVRGIQNRLTALEQGTSPSQVLAANTTFPRVERMGEDEITAARSAISEAYRLLTRCAALTDDTARARIRESLRQEVDELVITIIAFGREHPFAMLSNLERLREWSDRYYRDEQKKG